MQKKSIVTSSSGVKNSQAKSGKKQVPTAWRDRISPEDYQHLRDVFLIFDQDGSGTIDSQEIVKVLEELGLDKRNPYVVNIIWALRQKNKILNFDEFVDVVCSKTGQNKTKDGIRRVFDIYDKQQTGEIGFEQLKQISRFIGQNLTDDDLLQLMHSVYIKNGTQSNGSFSFDEFYQVVSQYWSRR